MVKVKELITRIKVVTRASGDTLEVPEADKQDSVLVLDQAVQEEDVDALVSEIEGKGYKAVVAAMFSDRLKQALQKSNLIPVLVSDRFFRKLFAGIKERTNSLLRIDMRFQEVQLVELMTKERFTINQLKRNCLMNGYSEQEVANNSTTDYPGLILG